MTAQYNLKRDEYGNEDRVVYLAREARAVLNVEVLGPEIRTGEAPCAMAYESWLKWQEYQLEGDSISDTVIRRLVRGER